MNTTMAASEQAIRDAHQLFSEYLKTEKSFYKPMSLEEFTHLFVTEEDGISKMFITDEKSKAFLAAVRDRESKKVFISFILVPRMMRRCGIARGLVNKLDDALELVDGENTSIEISFYNPIRLRWIIPDTLNHEHPNAPGIDLGSEAYLFFQNIGFRNFAYQNSYYRKLDSYVLPEKIRAKELELYEKGVTIQTYNERQMRGFEELFDDLGSQDWKRELTLEMSEKGENRPIIVPVFAGRVFGFAGPMYVETSGRGYFSGIGVHTDMRGKGVASVLFNRMCEALKGAGADYMTLFTGESNVARQIYESSGFKVVKSWANMRRERR